MANHLVIGLGGTGGAVLRALRKRIYEEFRSNEPAGKVNIEYLYVDSSLADLNDEESWQTLGASVQLAPAQRLSIHRIDPDILSVLNLYPGIRAFIHSGDEAILKEHFHEMLRDGDSGKCRRFGRMLMANNMCGLPQDTFVEQVHMRVRALREKEDTDVTFHICAGLGGGTGSGILIDAIAQLREEFRRTDRWEYKILLYLYVPEQDVWRTGSEHVNNYYQSNGYASLLELNAMSVHRYFPTDIKGTTDEHGKVRRLLKNQDAFDMAYLYTNVNEAGQEVDIRKVLPDIVGDFLFQKIVYSFMVKDRWMLGMESGEIDGLLPEENEAKELVRSRRFMTFGVKCIEYPEQEVVEYGAYLFAHQASMQMLYGLWDEEYGYVEGTEGAAEKRVANEVDRPSELEANLLTDDYLMLSKPLPSIKKHVTDWKPIVSGWELYIDRYKQEVLEEYQKAEWYEEFNRRCEEYFDSMYRGCGVKKFYFDYESQITGFAEEICRKIENNLLARWKKGTMSILEVHQYLTVLWSKCAGRVEGFKQKITKCTAYLNENLANELKEIHRERNNIGFMKDVITNAFVKTFYRFVDAKREQMTVMTEIYAYGYAVKLLSEVMNRLTLLKVNSVERLMRILSDFGETMKQQAEGRCKLSDADWNLGCGEGRKVYDPKRVREVVQGFLKNQVNQKAYADSLRAGIIEAVGTSNECFSTLNKKLNVGTLMEITLKNCMENAYKEMDDYSKKNPNQRLVDVNILDKLRATVCSTPDNRKRFVKELYDAAQSFLTFNSEEEGRGSSETAVNHQKRTHLFLPLCEDDDTFRNDFIQDFGENGTIPFSKDSNVSVSFKSNRIVAVTLHGGFPLRYVDNVRVLKEKYDILTRSEVNRMVVHTESFPES